MSYGFVVAGCGRSGSAFARGFAAQAEPQSLWLADRVPSRADELAAELGPAVAGTLAVSTSGRVAVPDQRHSEGVLVSFQPAGCQAKSAAGAVSRGWSVISTSWSEPDVRALLGLDEEARQRKVAVVVGAGFSPGLGALLASHGAKSLDLVDEIHLTRAGSAGPADARCYHAALSERSLDWFDGSWLRRPGGSGRQLSYFPEPIGPRDCYRAGLVDSLLLRRSFPEASRLTARLAATRRDRVTSRLPMLRSPHPDGGPGAVRVELWGLRGSARDALVVGVGGSPAEICATVVCEVARRLRQSRWDCFKRRETPEWVGSHGLAELGESTDFLRSLAAGGVGFREFHGSD